MMKNGIILPFTRQSEQLRIFVDGVDRTEIMSKVDTDFDSNSIFLIGNMKIGYN